MFFRYRGFRAKRQTHAIGARRSQRNRRALAGIAVAMGGLVFGLVLFTINLFLLSYLRGHECPSGTFMYGSTKLGELLSTVPWLFAGTLVFWTAVDVASNYLPHGAVLTTPVRSRRPNKGLSKMLRQTTGAVVLLAVLLLPFGILTGFCAMDDGVAFNGTPWSRGAKYEWQDVKAVTVACYYRSGRGGGDYGSFMLAMKDGAEIELFQTPRSFNEGYRSLRDALKDVSLRYDASQVRASCNSSLREFPPVGRRI
jgi:hypothetical protein